MNLGRVKPLWALLLFALALVLLNRLNQYELSQDPRHQMPFPIGNSSMEAISAGAAHDGALPTDTYFAQAYQNHASGLQLSIEGKVTYLFSGADAGAGYQKFTVQLGSGQSVIVIHNIQSGSVIEGLGIGDDVEVFGEYVWAPEGGIIQRTHQDPDGGYQAGWVKYKGRIYR